MFITDYGNVHTIPDRLSERLENHFGQPCFSHLLQLVWHDFCDDYDLERSDFQVIRSVPDSYLERPAPNVNGLFSRSVAFLGRNLVVTLLDLRLGVFWPTKTNTGHIDPLRCEQLNYVPVRSGPVRFP